MEGSKQGPGLVRMLRSGNTVFLYSDKQSSGDHKTQSTSNPENNAANDDMTQSEPQSPNDQHESDGTISTIGTQTDGDYIDGSATKRKRQNEEIEAKGDMRSTLKTYNTIGTETDDTKGNDVRRDVMVDMATITDECFSSKSYRTTGTETELNGVGGRATLESLLRWALAICSSDKASSKEYLEGLSQCSSNGSCPCFPAGTRLQRQVISNAQTNTIDNYIAVSKGSTHLQSDGNRFNKGGSKIEDVVFPAIVQTPRSLTNIEIQQPHNVEEENELRKVEVEPQQEEQMEIQESEIVLPSYQACASSAPRFLSKKELLRVSFQPDPFSDTTLTASIHSSSDTSRSLSFLADCASEVASSEADPIVPMSTEEPGKTNVVSLPQPRDGAEVVSDCCSPIIVDSWSLQPAYQSQMAASALVDLASQTTCNPSEAVHGAATAASSQAEALPLVFPPRSAESMTLPGPVVCKGGISTEPVIVQSWSLQNSQSETMPSTVFPETSEVSDNMEQKTVPCSSTQIKPLSRSSSGSSSEARRSQSELAANALVSLSSKGINDVAKPLKATSSNSTPFAIKPKPMPTKLWTSDNNVGDLNGGDPTKPIVVWPPQYEKPEPECDESAADTDSPSEPVILDSWSLQPLQSTPTQTDPDSEASSSGTTQPNQSELAATVLMDLASNGSGTEACSKGTGASKGVASGSRSLKVAITPKVVSLARSVKIKSKTVKEILEIKKSFNQSKSSSQPTSPSSVTSMASVTSNVVSGGTHTEPVMSPQPAPIGKGGYPTVKHVQTGPPVHHSNRVVSIQPAPPSAQSQNLDSIQISQVQSSSQVAQSLVPPNPLTAMEQLVGSSGEQSAAPNSSQPATSTRTATSALLYFANKATTGPPLPGSPQAAQPRTYLLTKVSGSDKPVMIPCYIQSSASMSTTPTVANSTGKVASKTSEPMMVSLLPMQPRMSTSATGQPNGGSSNSQAETKVVPLQLHNAGASTGIAGQAPSGMSDLKLVLLPSSSMAGISSSSSSSGIQTSMTLNTTASMPHQPRLVFVRPAQSGAALASSTQQVNMDGKTTGLLTFSSSGIPVMSTSIPTNTVGKAGSMASGSTLPVYQYLQPPQPGVSMGIATQNGLQGKAETAATRGAVTLPQQLDPRIIMLAPSGQKNISGASIKEEDMELSDPGQSEMEAANTLMNMPGRAVPEGMDMSPQSDGVPMSPTADLEAASTSAAADRDPESTSKTCEHCGKSFRNRSQLKVHYRVHTKERPYQCGVCKKKFIQLGHVTSHVLIHSKLRPYQCEVCKKTFRQKGTLKEHMPVHSGEKPFGCKMCDAKFAFRTLLRKHRQAEHPTDPINLCRETAEHPTDPINEHRETAEHPTEPIHEKRETVSDVELSPTPSQPN